MLQCAAGRAVQGPGSSHQASQRGGCAEACRSRHTRSGTGTRGTSGMRYVFGECELNTERYELRRRGQVVALEPLALRVLAYFVQHSGQAVAKGDLFQAFWPGATEESYKEYSLRNCLTKIRQAVGDAGTPRAVLDTVRRYGYRFTAEVTVLPSASRPADALGGADDQGFPGAGPDAPPAVPPDAVVRCPQCQTLTLTSRL